VFRWFPGCSTLYARQPLAFVEDPKSPIGGFARQDKTGLTGKAPLASPTAPQINNARRESEVLACS
jgi:hypothetical protein